ncbi:vWA domain-containing protein [Paenibacillus rigui]|uniref:VWFA domain-containing protein n=1 Tax=Paenibacillus rigui TaxID=554312 RepID=A0A229UY35_9BACL|nr:VWA domain-containing protein [Paenibacillus rigui]OXM87859.1 hypothetical protein CF651_01750 [Paenibacillus rigui]
MRFLENEVDAFLRMQLLDLGKALTGWQELKLEISYHSFYDDRARLIAVSSFWSDYPEAVKLAGMKSDVYLRGIGSAWFTDSRVIAEYLAWTHGLKRPLLAKQLFALCEETRLAHLCLRQRPGTRRALELRSRLYAQHFAAKRDAHGYRGEPADALLCAMAAALAGGEALQNEAPGSVPELLPALERLRWDAADAALHSTADVAERSRLVVELLEAADALGGDCRISYFAMLPENGTAEPLSWEYIGELKRKKKLKRESVLPADGEREEPLQPGERLPTWHRETEKQEESLLRFDIEEGSKTDLISNHVRESDSSDQALGIVQGSSKAVKQNEPNQPMPPAVERMETGESGGPGEPYGRLNRKAVPVYRAAEKPDAEALLRYQEVLLKISPMVSKLKRTIQMTMEQKQIARRGELISGRLGKKLIRAAWEPLPRLFYKKNNPSAQMDAVFGLLVDCSASMYDKMEQAHLGIALFHETLRTLRVPHEVIGFWEDADAVTEEAYPNTFQVITDFNGCLNPGAGPKLLQLQAEQDNRDGYAIRIVSERLRQRSEKQKVLLVFSDGEPSAAEYHEDGIMDTYEAVQLARRSGVDVVSVFIGKGSVKETERITMTNIYGRHSVVVPDVSDLAAQLTPLLRRLLISKL